MADGVPIVVPLVGNLKGLQRDLRVANSQMKGFGSGAKKILKSVAVIGAATLVGFGSVAVKGVQEFTALDKQVREVLTLSGDGATDVAVDNMTDRIREISKQYGQEASNVATSFYDSISAGVDSQLVDKFAEDAAKLATAGSTDISTAVDLLSSAVNAYGYSAEDAGDISDILFATVRAGKTTVGEISKSFSNMAPIAASVGVGLEDISAWMAQLTLSGTPTAQATTQIKSALAELSRTGSKSDKVLREITNKGFKDFIESGGSVAEALSLIEDNAKDNNLAIGDMFGSVEAVQGVLALTGDSAENFANILGDVKDSAGETDKAFEIMSKGASFQFDRLKANLSSVLGEIGRVVLPLVLKVTDYLLGLFDKLPSVSKVFNTLRTRVIAVARAIWTSLLPAWVFLYEKISPIISSIVDFFMGIDYAAIGEGIKESFFSALEEVKGFLSGIDYDAILGPLKDFLSGIDYAAIAEGLKDIFDAIVDFTREHPDVVLTAVAAALALIIAGPIVGGVAALAGAFYLAYTHSDSFRKAVGTVVDYIVDDLFPAIRNFPGKLAPFIKQIDDAIDRFNELVHLVETGEDEKGEGGSKVSFISVLIEEMKTVGIPGAQLVMDILTRMFDGFKATLRGLINFMFGVFVGDWGRAWAAISEIISGVFGIILAAPAEIIRKLDDFTVWLAEQLWLLFRGYLKAAFVDIPAVMKDAVVQVSGRLRLVGKEIAGFIWEGIKPSIKFLFVTLPQVLWVVVGALVTRFANVGSNIANSIWGGIKASVKSLFRTLPQILLDIAKTLVTVFVNVGKNIAGSIVSGILSGIKSSAGSIGNAVANAIPGGRVVKGLIGSIPGFAGGGVVTGPTLGIIGEAGKHEAVIPLDKYRGGVLSQGGGSVVNNYIYIQGGLSTSAEIGEMVEESLQKWEAHKGPLDIRVGGAA